MSCGVDPPPPPCMRAAGVCASSSPCSADYGCWCTACGSLWGALACHAGRLGVWGHLHSVPGSLQRRCWDADSIACLLLREGRSKALLAGQGTWDVSPGLHLLAVPWHGCTAGAPLPLKHPMCAAMPESCEHAGQVGRLHPTRAGCAMLPEPLLFPGRQQAGMSSGAGATPALQSASGHARLIAQHKDA